MKKHCQAIALGLVGLSADFTPSAFASMGKLVLTDGISSAEGAAVGGITPWAMIGTQAT
ncbi:DUF3034 family protein [Paraperlucidibaca baekdonensis]|uniref:DUF3034 family protein n=1 Tax=Paraperlucidibaca baekdonensis TaxID=748120 RepID=UPI001C6F1F7D|nr:DUF3034 family protein [Paraperlucidibaca baekdonensis]